MNRIKTFIKKLFTRKLVVINTPEIQYHVIEVDKESTSLIEGLGMDKERAMHFEKLVNRAYYEYNNTIAVIAEVSKECKHANELFFCSTIITHRLRDSQGPGGFLKEILGRR